MENIANVLLIVQLIVALGLIGVVLMQRSEGGALGMGGGGGGGGGMMSGRGAASALSKVTWVLAILFLTICLALTVIAAENSAGGSVVDGLVIDQSGEAAPALPSGLTGDLLPILPPAAE